MALFMGKLNDESKALPKDYPRIFLFGDSLTELAFNEDDCGFGWKLGQYYADRVEVVNEGYSGQTTKSLQAYFERYILRKARENGPPAPLLVTIFLGANDACFLGENTIVPIDEYEDYIRNYVTSILEEPAMKGTKVILISPPPVDVPTPPGADLFDIPSVEDTIRATAAQGRGHRTWQSKRLFAKKIVEIGKGFEAKADSVALLDFWTIITKHACNAHGSDFDELDLDDMLPGSGLPGVKEFGEEYFTDGLHFGKTAYEVLGRELLDLVLTKWPELKRENFPIREVKLGPIRTVFERISRSFDRIR